MHPIRSIWHAIKALRPRRQDPHADLMAGITGAVSSAPDGMAAGILAGVNPVQGLYASFTGPIVGGLTSSTRLMVITTTSAAALAAARPCGSCPRTSVRRQSPCSPW